MKYPARFLARNGLSTGPRFENSETAPQAGQSFGTALCFLKSASCGYFRFLVAYTVPMFGLPETRRCDFTVNCKSCRENIPAPVETMPASWIIAQSRLSSERRYYLPTDIFR